MPPESGEALLHQSASQILLDEGVASGSGSAQAPKSRVLLSAAPSFSRQIVDLFAGPGGWSEGLRMLGWSELGIEWDEAACATARAAGHERLQADVAALDPADYPCRGLIASPPCQAWSMAGKGGGRRDVLHVVACLIEMAAGRDTRDETSKLCEDPRSPLVVEPLRWIKALEPEWIALEQVPPVLELWELYADVLRGMGYSVWTGVLEAERYGVPQTRERAVLMASRVKAVQPPTATHQRYVAAEPRRHDVSMFGETLPWITMADALGWGMTERPCITVTAGSGRQGGADPLDGGSGARETLRRERDRGAWVYERPATAVCGDPRIFPPGWRGSPEDYARPEGPTRAGTDAIKVTLEEAGVLQSFRRDYPWQGTKREQHRQVGNAVPPLLAKAILGELVGERDQAVAA